MIPLETERLIIRNWEDRDRDLAYEINSDERVMQFFPFRRTRSEADAFVERLRRSIDENGFGFCALEIKETGETIGFTGIVRSNVVPTLPDNIIEIGWRLALRHWGKGYVSEAAREWLRFSFEDLDLDRIVSFAVHDNHRSTAVMERLGLHRAPEHDFDHSAIPESHAALRPHVVYLIDRTDWLEGERAGKAPARG